MAFFKLLKKKLMWLKKQKTNGFVYKCSGGCDTIFVTESNE